MANRGTEHNAIERAAIEHGAVEEGTAHERSARGRRPGASANPGNGRGAWYPWRHIPWIGMLLLGLILFVATNTGLGRDQVRQLAETQVSALLHGAQLDIGHLDGNLLVGLEARDIRVLSPEGSRLLALDRVQLRYRLWALLRSELLLDAAHIEGLQVHAEQQADSTWNWSALLQPSEGDSPWAVRIDTLSTRHTVAEAAFLSHAAQATLRVHDLDVAVSRLRMKPDGDLSVQTVRLRSAFQPPIRTDTVHVTLSGGYQDGMVRVDTLGLYSDRSRVTGAGRLHLAALPPVALPLPDARMAPRDTTTFRLNAAPLSLSDIASFLPMVRVGSQVEAMLDLTQQASQVHLTTRLSHPGGGWMAARLDWDQQLPGTHISARADAVGFDLDHLLGGPLDTSPASASLTLDLEGSALDSLSGQAALRAEPVVVNGVAFGATHMELSARSGFAVAAVRANISDALLAARISGRWLDAEPSMDLEGDIRNVDVASWMAPGGPSSRLAASFSGSTRGFDPTRMRSDLGVDILPSRFGRTDNITASARLHVQDGDLSWSARALLGGGSVRSEGRLGFSESLALRPSTMHIDSVDVTALLHDDSTNAPVTQVSAVLTAEADLESWQSGGGRIRLETGATRWGAFHLARSTTAVDWHAGRGAVQMAALPSDTSSIVLALDLHARGDGMRIESRELSWHQLDLRSMTVLGVPDALLQGQGTLRMDIQERALHRMHLSLHGGPSRWGVQQVPLFDLSLAADDETIEATVEGSFQGLQQAPSLWNATARLHDGDPGGPTWQFDLDFADLDPSAFVGGNDIGTALSGRARARGILAGTSARTDLDLELHRSRLRGEPLARAHLTGQLQDSVVTADAAFTVAEGRFETQIRARPFEAVPSFDANGSISRLNLLPLLGRADLNSDVNLEWTLSGTSFDIASANWQIGVKGEASRIDSLVVQAVDVAATWNGAVLDVERFSSRINEGAFWARGPLNLAPESSNAYSDFRATWAIEGLDALGPLVGLETFALPRGSMDLQVYGLPGQLDAQVRASLSDVHVDDARLFAIDASAWMVLDRAFLPVSTTATVDLGYVALPALATQASSLQIDQRGGAFSITAHTMVDEDNKMAVSAQIHPFSEQPEASLEQLDLVLGGAPFELARPVRVTSGEGWQMSPLMLSSKQQQLSLSGAYSNATGYVVRLDMASLDLAPLGAFIRLPDLEGRIGGGVLISDALGALDLDSQLEIELTDLGNPLAVLRTDLRSIPEGLLIDAAVETPDGEDISVEGVLPVFSSRDTAARGSEELNVNLRTEGGSIRWLNPLLDPTLISDLEGVLTMDAELRGTIEDPQLAGFLHLDGTRFRLPEYGVVYRMDRFRSTLQGVSLSINEARLRSGGGQVDVFGQINFASLTNSSFDLRAELDRFRAVRNDELQTTLSGALQLAGRTTRPELTGSLTTSNTSFWPTETAGGDLRQFPLSIEDERMLAENFGYRSVIADTLADAIWTGLSMDLSIALERDTWIRQRVNPEMAIELSGRIDLQKDQGQEEVRLFRSIEVLPDRSTIKQFGRNFRIAEGVAQFNGPIEEMVLQVKADYEVPSRLNPGQPEVLITLRLDGRLDDLAFELSSDPAMENTDIVSYIATGRPASESMQFNDSSVNNQVLVGLAASQLAGLVEGVASQSLGLDVVSIEQDGLKGTRLTAGKYMTPRLFVGVTQPFSFSGGSGLVVDKERELTLEYEVLEYLLLQLLADASDSPVRINLAGRYSY